MKKTVLIFFMFLAACASSPKPAPPVAKTPAQVHQDNCAKIAAILLNAGQPEGKTTFLSSLNNETSAKIVAGAIKKFIPEDMAAQVAGFLESTQGQTGVKLFSNYLMTGQFLKGSAPPEMDSSWKTFRETPAGTKLFSEGSNIYKQIAIDAFKMGGENVKKGIISDVGNEGAKQIFGAFLKAGAFFK